LPRSVSSFDNASMSRRPDVFALMLFCPIVLGCDSISEPVSKPASPQPAETAPQSPSPSAAKDTSTGGSWGPELAAKIKVEDGAGKEVFSIKPEHDGAKLVDASGREIARYNLKGDKLKVKDSADRVLGYVTGSGGKYHVKDPEQKTVLFELQRQADGDWKLEDGHEKRLYKIKKRDYGFEIEDADEKSLAKVKTKDGKVSLRDASDKTRYATHSSAASPLLVTCLSLDRVGDLSVKVALMVRIVLDDATHRVPKGDSKP
jgi:hypothetical protein